jgi:hypothetical protein
MRSRYALRSFPRVVGDRVSLRLRFGVRVRDVDAEVRPAVVAAAPEREAAVAVLAVVEPFEVARDLRFELGARRELGTVETLRARRAARRSP